MTTDLELTNRVASGDADAIAMLYDRFGRLVYRMASRIVGDHTWADDVLQATFVQVVEQADRLDASRGSVAGWLLAIARSRAIDHARAARAGRERLTQLDEGEGCGERRPSASPEEAFLAAETAAKLHAAVRALPVPQRIAVELAFFRGLTHAEIAAALRAQLGTVKTRIRLAMERLRDGLTTGDLPVTEAEPSPFTVTLIDYLSANAPAERPLPPSLEGVSVLVVDDDRETVELVRTVLESSGARVATAQSAAEALVRLRAAWPDVLLADLGMPTADGYALLRRVVAEARGRRLRAAAFTARQDTSERVMAAGFQRHLRKPLEPRSIVDAVAALARPDRTPPACG